MTTPHATPGHRDRSRGPKSAAEGLPAQLIKEIDKLVATKQPDGFIVTRPAAHYSLDESVIKYFQLISFQEQRNKTTSRLEGVPESVKWFDFDFARTLLVSLENVSHHPRPSVDIEAVAEPYEAKLRAIEGRLSQLQWEKALEEAWKSRELMSALMAEEWLGLRLLLELHQFGKQQSSEIARRTGADIDRVGAVLARLLKFEAVEVHGLAFSSSELGSETLRKLRVNSWSVK
jgi:hypothetical protein